MQNEYTADDVPSSFSAPAEATTSADEAATTTTTPPSPSSSKDGEVMSKSNVSDAFGSWTILTNKNDRMKSKGFDLMQDRIELLERDAMPDDEKSSVEELTPITPKFKTVEEPQTDDLSDGISIISDGESTELIGMSDGDFRGSSSGHNTTPFSIASDDSEPSQRLRNRRGNSQQSLDTSAESSDLESPPINSRNESEMSAHFRIIVTMTAIIVFIVYMAKLGPQHQNLDSIIKIRKQLNDMELQNNLMRSEIDILSKQVSYLGELEDRLGGRKNEQPKQRNQRQGKTFKAWTGNGNNMDPVHITKQNLKQPYRCPDGESVENPELCANPKANAEKVVEYIKDTIDEVLKQTQTDDNGDNNDEMNVQVEDIDIDENNLNEQPEMETSPYRSPNLKIRNGKLNVLSRDRKFLDHISPDTLEEWLDELEAESNELEAKLKAKQRFLKLSEKSKQNYKRAYDHAKEHIKRAHDHNSKEKYNNTKSKMDNNNNNDNHNNKYNDNHNNKYNDNHNKKYKEDSPIEYRHSYNRNNNNNHKNSKERFFNNKKSTYPEASKHNKQHDNSGEWQEQMMHHREDVRRQHDEQQHDDKNWYIERGDSREHLRYAETPVEI